jgi:hypothetical protein
VPPPTDTPVIPTPTNTPEIPGVTPTFTETVEPSATPTIPVDPTATSTEPVDPEITPTVPGEATATATLQPTLPPPPSESTPFLIPVTGGEQTQFNMDQTANWLINLSMIFLGLGLVLTMIGKKFIH